MRGVSLYKKLPGERVVCNLCQWQCTIGLEKTGVCHMNRNIDGKLYSLNYADISSVNADPIEKKPLFHFYPGSKVFSLGTWGCNFHCRGCQNWQIACTEGSTLEKHSSTLLPEESVTLAKREGCQGIAWTYNEPAIWFDYTLDSAKIAKQNGLYTVYVTNGYISQDALDAIGPYLDGYCVDIKGFTDEFYRDMTKITDWRGILDVTERAKSKWGMHVEVVTNIVPQMNDDSEQLEALASWIYDKLGELTPWHVTRFYPQHEMQDIPPTSISVLERAYDVGKRAGLKFVYCGNVPRHECENTVCYSCGNKIIRRVGYSVDICGLKGDKCLFCNADLNMIVGEK